jgi:hypothetical protein
MRQPDEYRSQEAGSLQPEELAAEHAAELPDREAMSLITGPGGMGPFPVMGHPIAYPGDPGGSDPGSALPDPQPVAQPADAVPTQ